MSAERAATRPRPETPRYRYTRRHWHGLFRAIDAVGAALFFTARRLLRQDPRGAQPSGEPNQILLIQLDHLGDAIISLPLVRELRAQYPAARIDVLCGAWNRPWFASLAEIDRVEALRFNRFARDGRGRWLCWLPALLVTALRLRARRYDWAIDVRGEFPHALLMWLASARRRVGWNCGGGGFLLTDSPPYVLGRPEALSRRALLRELNIRPSIESSGPYEPGERARAAIATRLATLPLGHDPLVVLHVGAGTQARRWPAEHWRELAARLVAEERAHVVLIGSKAEADIARQVAREQTDDQFVVVASGQTVPETLPSILSKIHDWTGQLSIRETAALLARATVFVGADSGPAHLAAAVGTSSVVLFSGTNAADQWKPNGPDVETLSHPVECAGCHRTRCPLAHHPCMRGLTVKRVYEAVSERLARRASPAPVLRRAVSFAVDGAVARPQSWSRITIATEPAVAR